MDLHRPIEEAPQRAVRSALLVATGVFFALVFLFFAVYRNWNERTITEAKNRAHTHLLDIQKNILLSMGKIEMFATTFGIRVEEYLHVQDDFALHSFDRYLSYHRTVSPAFLFATLTDQRLITIDQYPRGAGEALGFDLKTLEAYHAHIAQPIAAQEVIVDGPLRSYDGSYRLVVRYPLYREAVFQGILSLHYDFTQFVQALGTDATSSSYRYFLHFFHQGGGEAYYGGHQMDEKIESVTLKASYSSLQWLMSVQPIGGWTHHLFLRHCFFLLVLFLAAALSLSIFSAIQRYKQMQWYSTTDSLTGLLSRRGFERLLDQQLAIGQPFSVALIDIDNFKSINDNYGHVQGDNALILFAQHLRAIVGQKAAISRYGGDEFVLLFPHCWDVPSLITLFGELSGASLSVDGKEVVLQLSMAVTSTDDDGYDGDRMRRSLDDQLHKAKQNGKAQLCAYGVLRS